MTRPVSAPELARLAHCGKNMGRRCGEDTWRGIAYRLEQCSCKCDHGKSDGSVAGCDTVSAVKLAVGEVSSAPL